uniref:Uncharacterized protein n=1 Tax=Arion vulgaris TaxID=1028688 RepID=A0A0B6ZMZ1_9EUPU
MQNLIDIYAHRSGFVICTLGSEILRLRSGCTTQVALSFVHLVLGFGLAYIMQMSERKEQEKGCMVNATL